MVEYMQKTMTKEQNTTYDLNKFVNKHMYVVKDMKELNSIPDAWALSVRKFATSDAIKDDYTGLRLTYKEAYEKICTVAAALQSLGIKKYSHVAQFSENSGRWMICDQAIQKCGGLNAVRGSAAPLEELKYIYTHSDCCALVTDSKNVVLGLYEYLLENNAKFVIYIGTEDISDAKGLNIPLYTFDDMLKIGKNKEFTPVRLHADDVATIVYSSGTTGRPKGIMLTNANLISQLFAINASGVLDIKTNQSALNVLPVWHMYERTVEYYVMYCGATLCYTNIRNFKKDLKKFKPDVMVAVPRLFEAIYETVMSEMKSKTNLEKSIFTFFLNASKFYKKSLSILDNNHRDVPNPSRLLRTRCAISAACLYPVDKLANELVFSKIKKALGGKLPRFVSGGGALAPAIADFFNAINVEMAVGYGLTETAPILTVNRFSRNRLYTAGQPLPDTEIAIVDPDKLTLMPKGKKGLVLAKGPQIMKGYYKDKEATDKVILKTGWFITGDLGWMSEDNFLTLTGRAKDIIVLSNGENIEPDALEQTCALSDFVKQIVMVGQDRSCLGALIKTDEEAVIAWAQENGVKEETAQKDPMFKKMLLKELNSRISSRPNFRPFERLGDIRFIDEGFTIENGLMTFTAKIRKNVVFDKYEKLIDEMYKV